MNTANLQKLPVTERLRIGEELWESIERGQQDIPLIPEHKAELDRVINAYELDGDRGRSKDEAFADLRKRL